MRAQRCWERGYQQRRRARRQFSGNLKLVVFGGLAERPLPRIQALDVCIALLELKPMAGEAYAPPPGAVGADTPLSQRELDAAVKAAAVQVAAHALLSACVRVVNSHLVTWHSGR